MSFRILGLCLVGFALFQHPPSTAQQAIDSLKAVNLMDDGLTFIKDKQYEKGYKSLVKVSDYFLQKGDIDQYLKAQLEANYALTQQNKYTEAIKLLDPTLKVISQIKPNGIKIHSAIHKAQGNNYYESGDYHPAENQYLTSLAILETLNENDFNGLASLYNRLGNTYRHMSDYANALHYIKKAVNIAEKNFSEENPDYSGYYHSLGYIYYKQSRFDEAINYYQRSLKLRVKYFGENHRFVADSHLNISSVYTEKGNYLRSFENLEKALAIYKKVYGPNHTRIASCYNNIGLCLRHLGDNAQAKLYHQAALDLKIDIHGADHPRVAKYYYNLGVILEEESNYAEADNYYKKSLDIKLETYGSIHPNIAGGYANLGIIQYKLKNYHQALALLEKGLSIQLQAVGELQKYTPAFYSNLARVYHDMDQYDKALKLVETSLALENKIHNSHHSNIAANYIHMAEILLKKNKIPEARAVNEKALVALNPNLKILASLSVKSIEDIPQKIELLGIIENKALIEEALYDDKDPEQLIAAFRYYQLAITIMDNLRDNYYLKNAFQHTPDRFMSIYEKALSVAFRLEALTEDKKYISDAFTIAEKSKAVTLIANLQDNYAKKFAGVPNSLIEKEHDLSADILFVKNLIWEIEKKNLTELNSFKLPELQKKLVLLKRNKDSLITVAEKNYPAYFKLKFQRKYYTIPEIQHELLTGNKALIEYFVGENDIYYFGIGKEKTIAKTTKKPTGFNPDIQDLRDFLIEKSNNLTYFTTLSHRLYNLLIAPLEDIGQQPELTIITDGLLGYLPFDILIKSTGIQDNTNFKDLDYLLKNQQINYAFSANYLIENQNTKTNFANDYLALAPSFGTTVAKENDESMMLYASNDIIRNTLVELKYAPNEIRSLAKYIDGSFFEGKLATEQAFKSSASQYGILHLATHAIVDDVNPMNSRLLFSQDNDSIDDGNLYAWELYNMKLNAQMAVLSACNTGYGQIQRGEGVLSIARSFAYAGCPAIVMSLWPAQDKTTAAIMDNFYEGLSKGYSKDKALNLAKLSFLENGDDLFSHPFYWASFVAQGDPRPLLMEKTQRGWIFYALGMIIIIIISGTFIRSKKLKNTSG